MLHRYYMTMIAMIYSEKLIAIFTKIIRYRLIEYWPIIDSTNQENQAFC